MTERDELLAAAERVLTWKGEPYRDDAQLLARHVRDTLASPTCPCGGDYCTDPDCDWPDVLGPAVDVDAVWREAVQHIRDQYPAEWFGKLGGKDAASAAFARKVCDNILAEVARRMGIELPEKSGGEG